MQAEPDRKSSEIVKIPSDRRTNDIKCQVILRAWHFKFRIQHCPASGLQILHISTQLRFPSEDMEQEPGISAA